MLRKYWKNTKENGVWKGQSPILKEGAEERHLRPPPIIPNPRQNTGFLGADGGHRKAHCQLLNHTSDLRRPGWCQGQCPWLSSALKSGMSWKAWATPRFRRVGHVLPSPHCQQIHS